MNQGTTPDYRAYRDGTIEIVSDRARHRAVGPPTAAGTRVVFRTIVEAEEFIQFAERDGFSVERVA